MSRPDPRTRILAAIYAARDGKRLGSPAWRDLDTAASALADEAPSRAVVECIAVIVGYRVDGALGDDILTAWGAT